MKRKRFTRSTKIPGPCVANYYKEPLVLDRGKEIPYDIEGKEYLDFFGGILTISVVIATKRSHPRPANR